MYRSLSISFPAQSVANKVFRVRTRKLLSSLPEPPLENAVRILKKKIG
jgi:hypothetical protein